jgi:hypothetical protein
MRMVLDDETWLEIRRAYEETTEAVRLIAVRYGVARSTVHDRALREGWAPRRVGVRRVAPPPAAAPAVSIVPETALEAEPFTPRPPDSPEERLARFYRIIDRLLEKMERNVSNAADLSPQDQERHARAVASTLSSMERVTEIAGDLLPGAAKTDGDASHANAEAERMRREIAERLDRLSAKWLAQTQAE